MKDGKYENFILNISENENFTIAGSLINVLIFFIPWEKLFGVMWKTVSRLIQKKPNTIMKVLGLNKYVQKIVNKLKLRGIISGKNVGQILDFIKNR